ncbi:MAG TPA: type II toxin-antitoxin system RelE/ParE family toxin [Polyangium sp.]|nr:type II toxin-antitoxin system RelE/ParE family toxin [Polyangium sp.]
MINVLDEAAEELLSAAKWYDAERHGLGDQLLADVNLAFMAIEENPMTWPAAPGSRGARRLLCKRFPYVAYYVVRDSIIWIVAVAHTSRQPGYWHHRVKH